MSAWNAPSIGTVPPDNNVSAPVTISASDQEKFGGLTVASLLSTGGIRAFGRVQVGSTTVACSATVAGSLRWTGTAMEHCNGTAWLPFGGSSGISSITGGSCGVGQVVKSISTTGAVTCIAALGVAGGGVPNAYCGQCFAFSGNEGSNSGIQQNCSNGVITSITPCSVYVAPWGN